MKKATNLNYTILTRQSRYSFQEHHFDNLETAIRCARTEYTLSRLNSDFLSNYDSDWFYLKNSVA